jgi:acetolactate synthase-1/2/3 large subunit
VNGAESILRTLARGGVELCLTNPGTSELQFVSAFDRVQEIRPVLGLFEGVLSGAADGYARMADKPAATLFHLGPGLANALANFHNARRARSPIVNLVGEHATYHRRYDPPLASDIASYAKPVSGWIRTMERVEDTPRDARDAVLAAFEPPGQIATLIVPADCAWQDAPEPIEVPAPKVPALVENDAVKACAAALRSDEPSLLFLTGRALRAPALEMASRIGAGTGARVMCDIFNARVERGAGRASIERLPYFPQQMIEALAGTKHLILVGTKPPVTFFAYPGFRSLPAPEDCEVLTLSEPGEDAFDALARLADEVGASSNEAVTHTRSRPTMPEGELTAESVALTVAALLPENAIVSDEANTAGLAIWPHTASAAPHDWLFLTGGAIGQGLPLATGAALACPDRKVIALQADGAAMYTLQALWTQAREKLDVTTLVYANRSYRVLQIELHAAGETPGPRASRVLDIGNPDLDWVRMAEAMGVSAVRATSVEQLRDRLETFLGERGPNLIELVL